TPSVPASAVATASEPLGNKCSDTGESSKGSRSSQRRFAFFSKLADALYQRFSSTRFSPARARNGAPGPATIGLSTPEPEGRLSRADLPLLPATAAHSDPDSAPATPTQVVVARIWEEVLGTSRFGIHDDFFELGGHSVLIQQVMASINQRFDVELPLRSLLEAPTVYGLAQSIETVRRIHGGAGRADLAGTRGSAVV